MAVTAKEVEAFTFLGDLTQSTLARLCHLANRVQFEAGNLLYEQGAPPAGLFLIASGHVILYRQSGERLQILALAYPFECIGGESIANNNPNPYTAKAGSDCAAFCISPDDLHALLMQHPDFLGMFLRLVTQRLRQLTILVHDLAFRDVASRLAGVFIMLANAQQPPHKEGNIVIPRIFSQQELAAIVGTAREVISRTIKHFEQDGLIEKSGKSYIILDLKRLKDTAAQESR